MNFRVLITCFVMAFSVQGIAGKKKKKNKGRDKPSAAQVRDDNAAAANTEPLGAVEMVQVLLESESAPADIVGEAQDRNLFAPWDTIIDGYGPRGEPIKLIFITTGHVDRDKFIANLKYINNFTEKNFARQYIHKNGHLTFKQKIHFFLMRSSDINIFTKEEEVLGKRITRKLILTAAGRGTREDKTLTQAELEWLHTRFQMIPSILGYEVVTAQFDAQGELTPQTKAEVEAKKKKLEQASYAAILKALQGGRDDAFMANMRAVELMAEAEYEKEQQQAEADRIEALELAEATARSMVDQGLMEALGLELPQPPQAGEGGAAADDQSEGVDEDLFAGRTHPFRSIDEPQTPSSGSSAATPDTFSPLRRTNSDILFPFRIARWRAFAGAQSALEEFRRNAENFHGYVFENEADALRAAAYHRALFLPNLLLAELGGFSVPHFNHSYHYLNPETRQVRENGEVQYTFFGKVKIGTGPAVEGKFEVVFTQNPGTGTYRFYHIWFVADTAEHEAQQNRAAFAEDMGHLDADEAKLEDDAFEAAGRHPFIFDLDDATGDLIVLDHSFPGGLTFYIHPHLIQEIVDARQAPTTDELERAIGGDDDDAAAALDPRLLPVPTFVLPDPEFPGDDERDAAAAFGMTGSGE